LTGFENSPADLSKQGWDGKVDDGGQWNSQGLMLSHGINAALNVIFTLTGTVGESWVRGEE